MKQSEKNLMLIDNFLLYATGMSRGDDNGIRWCTPAKLYQLALDYIAEDHVDGEPADEPVQESNFLSQLNKHGKKIYRELKAYLQKAWDSGSPEERRMIAELGNQGIVNLIFMKPRTSTELMTVNGVPARFLVSIADGILEILNRWGEPMPEPVKDQLKAIDRIMQPVRERDTFNP